LICELRRLAALNVSAPLKRSIASHTLTGFVLAAILGMSGLDYSFSQVRKPEHVLYAGVEHKHRPADEVAREQVEHAVRAPHPEELADSELDERCGQVGELQRGEQEQVEVAPTLLDDADTESPDHIGHLPRVCLPADGVEHVLRELEAGEIGEEVVDIGLIVDEGEEDAGIVEYVCGFARPPFE
jgi:hypothetical protein